MTARTLAARITAPLVAAVVAAAALPAPASETSGRTAGSPRFRVDTPFIKDRRGRVRFFHGVNAVWKRPPYFAPSTLNGVPRRKSYFDARDGRFLRRTGLNSVRLGNLFVGTEPERDRYDESYLDRTEEFVDMLARHDVTVMIDFHQDMWHERYEGEGFPDWATVVPATNCCGFPGNYFTPGVTGAFERLWQNDDNLWNEYRDAWTHVAARFKDKRNLIGYDLLNEPWPGAQYESCMNPAGCPQFDTEFLQPFMEHVIAGIRTVDNNSIIWWDPHVITNSGAKNNVGLNEPIRDPGSNQGISFHIYCIAGSEATPVRPGDDPSCAQSEPFAFANQQEAAARNRSSLFLTEFGATEDLRELRRATRLADQHMVSWHYWHYGEWNDPTTAGVGGTQGLFRDDLKRPHSLKRRKARVLIRTYPQAVAGRPRAFQFFLGRYRLFRLVFRSNVAIDAPSVIFVPRRHYRKGYVARVRGPARFVRSARAKRFVGYRKYLRLRNTGTGRVVVRIVRRPR